MINFSNLTNVELVGFCVDESKKSIGINIIESMLCARLKPMYDNINNLISDSNNIIKDLYDDESIKFSCTDGTKLIEDFNIIKINIPLQNILNINDKRFDRCYYYYIYYFTDIKNNIYPFFIRASSFIIDKYSNNKNYNIFLSLGSLNHILE